MSQAETETHTRRPLARPVAWWPLSLGLVLLAEATVVAQGLAVPPPPAPSSEPVFTVVFEARGESDGYSATSKVEVQLAPGPIWRGYLGTYIPARGGGTPHDSRSPAALYKTRGGLDGLRPGEPMTFGILSHSGSAHASTGRTIHRPGAIQQGSSGTSWTLKEDVARFKRTEDGGELLCVPIIYMDEEPPEFSLLGPGTYPLTKTGEADYQKLIRFRFTKEELSSSSPVRKVNEASVTSKDGTIRQWFRSTLVATFSAEEVEILATPGGLPAQVQQVQPRGVTAAVSIAPTATIRWAVSDRVISTGVRSGGGMFHPFSKLEDGSVVNATPEVVMTHSPRLWQVTQITLPAVREIKRPVPDAFPVAHRNVFDDPRRGLQDGHFEDVARNLESYGPTTVAQMHWWAEGATEAHEDSHRADWEAWFRKCWFEKDGLKVKLQQRLRELVNQSKPTVEQLSAAAGVILMAEINAARNDAALRYVGDEDKAYRAGAKVFLKLAADLRKEFARKK